MLATSSVVSLALSVQPDAAAMINALEVDSIGYDVTTVLNGNLRGLSFYCIDEATDRAPAWAIVLDSTKSKVLRVQLPLSQDSVVEHIAGSLEGKAGYQDGRGGDALFNHPKMLTLDSDGNIYVADVRNTAIRMITTQGFVTTIAGGMNRTGHNDGEGRVVTFSNDFGVTYLRKNCTLLIVDRGNRMVRAMKLPHLVGRCHDSPSDVPGGFTNGKTLLVAVGILLYSGIILGASTGWLKKLQSKLPWSDTQRSRTQPAITPIESHDIEGQTPFLIPADDEPVLRNSAEIFHREEFANHPQDDSHSENLIDFTDNISRKAPSQHDQNSDSEGESETTTEFTPEVHVVTREERLDSMMQQCLVCLTTPSAKTQ